MKNNWSPFLIINEKQLSTNQVFRTKKEAVECARNLKFNRHWAKSFGAIKVNKKVNRRFIFGFAELL